MGENPSPLGEVFRLTNLVQCKTNGRPRMTYMI